VGGGITLHHHTYYHYYHSSDKRSFDRYNFFFTLYSTFLVAVCLLVIACSYTTYSTCVCFLLHITYRDKRSWVEQIQSKSDTCVCVSNEKNIFNTFSSKVTIWI